MKTRAMMCVPMSGLNTLRLEGQRTSYLVFVRQNVAYSTNPPPWRQRPRGYRNPWDAAPAHAQLRLFAFRLRLGRRGHDPRPSRKGGNDEAQQAAESAIRAFRRSSKLFHPNDGIYHRTLTKAVVILFALRKATT